MRSCGVDRIEVPAAAGFRRAFQRPGFTGLQAEADDVHHELDAAGPGLAHHHAQAAAAGLGTVRQQDDGRFLAIAPELLDDLRGGPGKRRLAERADRVQDRRHGTRVRIRQRGLDVLTVPFAAVPVCDQANLLLIGQVPDGGRHDLAGDLNLGLAIDVAPHRSAGVVDEHDGRASSTFVGPGRKTKHEHDLRPIHGPPNAG